MSRLVGYVRVSVASRREGDSGTRGESESLAAQREAIATWAAAAGHEVVRFEADDGVSGVKGEDERPGLARALEAVRSGDVEGLVAHRLDRIARSLTLSEVVLATCWQAGGRVFTTEGEVPMDASDDPLKKALRQMAAVYSELERNMMIARTEAGRRRRAAQGKHLGGQRPPLGFGVDSDGTLVPHRGEQRRLGQARQMRDDGASWRQIAAKTGFQPESIRRVLAREQRANV